MKIQQEILSLKDEIVDIRRHLHKYPEISFEEKHTGEFISDYLKKLGIDHENGVAGYGVVGYMYGNGEKTYAFRADMDALPVHEETGLDFASCSDGVMHACGHDGHMAMLLGLARYLSTIKGRLKGNVIFIFQPGEESTGGALPIIKSGLFDRNRVDAIFGYHISPEVEEGKIGLKSGPVMAMTGEVDVDIRGKSAHGAMPHKGVDAVIIASQFLQQAQTIISRYKDPLESAVITFGKIYGGSIRNIIADKVRLEGTIRTFYEGVFENIRKMMKNISKGFEIGFGAKIDVDIRDTYPPVINDDNLYQLVVRSLDSDDYVSIKPIMLADDFSFYQKVCPGVYMMLGSKNEKSGYVYPLHHSRFDFDEDILLTGIQAYCDILRGAGVL